MVQGTITELLRGQTVRYNLKQVMLQLFLIYFPLLHLYQHRNKELAYTEQPLQQLLFNSSVISRKYKEITLVVSSFKK